MFPASIANEKKKEYYGNDIIFDLKKKNYVENSILTHSNVIAIIICTRVGIILKHSYLMR